MTFERPCRIGIFKKAQQRPSDLKEKKNTKKNIPEHNLLKTMTDGPRGGKTI